MIIKKQKIRTQVIEKITAASFIGVGFKRIKKLLQALLGYW
jgi:hypothetical protein